MMEPVTAKPGFLKNILVRCLLFGVVMVLFRFAYVITLTGESCRVGNFCFLKENLNFVFANTGAVAVNGAFSTGTVRKDVYTSKDWIKAVHFYSSVFEDLISQGFLSPESKSLCVETPTGQEVRALKETGVKDAVGIFKKASRPLVVPGEAHRMPFEDSSFDFVFSGDGRLDKSPKAADFAAEIVRTLRPKGLRMAIVSIG